MRAEDSRLMSDSTQISEARSIGHAEVGSASVAAEQQAAAQSDLWIFRDGRKLVSGPEMVRDLVRRMSSPAAARSQSLLDALIEAGELEAALADGNSPSSATASRLTDELAFAVCSGHEVDR